MRKSLRDIEGEELRFLAHFSRMGSFDSCGESVKTLCLESVRVVEGGVVIADHLWFRLAGAEWPEDLARGDLLLFRACAVKYERGYDGIFRPYKPNYGIEDDYLLRIKGLVERLKIH